MADFEIKRSTRRCSKTDHEFQPGDVFYSALVAKDEAFHRLDYSVDAWNGPPDDAVGWWKCQVPERNQNRVYWAPNKVLLAYFEQLLEKESKADIAYVMSLLLIRKRLLRLVDTFEVQGESQMLLHSNFLKKDFQIREESLTANRISTIQEELSEHLFMDRPNGEDADDDEENECDDVESADKK